MSLLAALLTQQIRADAADPHWPDRDRLVIAAGDVSAHPLAQHLAGPPGLAFGTAVGMAIAERIMAARFGRSLVDHRTWLVAGAQDLASGMAQEAAFAAGALVLGRLAVLASLPADQPRLRAGFAAAGWSVRVIQAGDDAAADAALATCQRSQKPTLVLQIIDPGRAYAAPRPAQPGDGALSPSARRGSGARRAWLQRLRRHASRDAFHHALAGHLPPGWQKLAHVEDSPAPFGAMGTTQNAVLAGLGRLAAVLPDMTALPALEAGPLGLQAGAHQALPDHPVWAGRDLATGAALFGMALHGGILPAALSSAAVSDLLLPALRAGAAHQTRWLQLLTGHEADLGAASLAVIPNIHVYQPADAAEALDCLVLALRRPDGPGLMLLSDASYTRLPPRTPHLCARGAYLVHAPPERAVTLLAAGPALGPALLVHAALAAQNVAAALVSIPCRALFDLQEAAYRDAVLGHVPAIIFGPVASLTFAGLAGPDALAIDLPHIAPDPAAMAARIVRHMQCSPPHPEAA